MPNILKDVSVYDQLGNILNVSVGLPLVIYYTYTYMIMPISLKSYNLSNVFFITLLCEWISIPIRVTDMYVTMKYSLAIMHKNVWNYRLYSNRFPFSLLKIYHIIDLINKIQLIVTIIPFSYERCGIYNKYIDSEGSSCRMAWIMTISGYIEWSIFVFAILRIIIGKLIEWFKKRNSEEENLLFVSPVSDSSDSSDSSYSSKTIVRTGYIPSNKEEFMLRYLPVNCVKPKNNACCLCNTYDPLNRKFFREWVNYLECNHNIHSACIEKYFCDDRICPVCHKIKKREMVNYFDYSDSDW